MEAEAVTSQQRRFEKWSGAAWREGLIVESKGERCGRMVESENALAVLAARQLHS
jgi:hypothetical protein